MSTHTFNVLPAADTVPHFVAWGSALSAALDAIGLTRTADTGQVNWGTIASVPTSGTSGAAYEIRTFTDALQATAPVYIRIAYGFSTYPSIWITIGQGTDGAGNLTGNINNIATIYIISTGVNTAWTYSWYVSGDTGRVVALMGTTPGSTLQSMFSIERTLNASGNPTGDGVIFQYSSGQSNVYATVWIITPGYAAFNETVGGGMLPRSEVSGSSTSLLGATVAIAPPSFWTPTGGVAYTKNLVSIPPLPKGTLLHPVRFGATHTYMSMGSSAWYGYGARSGNSGDSSAVPAMLWE